MSRRNLSLLVATLLLSVVCHSRNIQNPHGRYVVEGFEEIERWALDRPADDELVAGAMRGMIDVLRRRGDQHSRYLRPQAAQQLREQISGGFGGVGVRIRMLGDPPQLTVVGPPEPGTPAFYGGVRPDDHIVAIDGANTAGLTMNDVLDQMRGAVGEPVTLSIQRTGAEQPITISLERETIQVPSVIGDQRLSDGSWRYRLDQDRRIALVRITTFGDRTVEELRRLLPALSSEGAEAFVVDLRDNAGGALEAAVGACGLFLLEGAPIVETRGRDGSVGERFASDGGAFRTQPIAVLVNRNSASASEIMAACLQDNGRAVVVGERSFGKGTVQRLVPLEAGRSLLKITSASYWRPSGANIHRGPDTPEDADWGVRPDRGLEAPLEEQAYRAYLAARSARDLMAIDQVGDSAGDDLANSETSTDTATGKAAAMPYIDAVLDRAVEHLQSVLDARAARNIAASPAS